MKNLYFLFIALLAFTFTYAQTRTVTFEDETANWVVGGGSTQTVEADPDDASNSVLKIQYVAGQQWDNWGGIEIPVGADMMKSDQVSFKIKTSDHGDSAGSFGYLFKLEGPSGNIQKPFIVDGSTNWQTITIDYSTCDNQNAAADAGQCQVGNAAGQFTKLVLHHWGGSNPSSPDTEAIYIFSIDGVWSSIFRNSSISLLEKTPRDSTICSAQILHLTLELPASISTLIHTLAD